MSELANDIANLELFLSGYTCAEDCILADILDPDENLLTIGMLRSILAALSHPADHAGLVEALVRAKNDLLEVGNDYPGSSCQKWCTERAAAAWNVLTPWKHCPSTHCERAQECRSVNECSAEKRTLNRVNSAALAGLIADTADHPEPDATALRNPKP